MEIGPYGGWARCGFFRTDALELIATLEVGPRIISLRREGGENVLAQYPAQMGLVGGGDYRSYGGHRLWAAPEDPSITYEPDNEPVQIEERDGLTWLRGAPAGTFAKSIGILLDDKGVRLHHELKLIGDAPRIAAAWAITVMRPGGECVFPLAPFVPHPQGLLPAMPIVLWPYADMSDPRFAWASRVVRMRQDANGGPLKIGALVRQGIAAYQLPGELFVKRFEFHENVQYPDFGCNFETFTRQDMLEVESLSPLRQLSPGEAIQMEERWMLLPEQLPQDGSLCAGRLNALAAPIIHS